MNNTHTHTHTHARDLIIVIGSNGQLGSDFVVCAESAGHRVVGTDYPDIDIRDAASADDVVGGIIDRDKNYVLYHDHNHDHNQDHNKDQSASAQQRKIFIVNCAAFTAVDECETNHDAAFALNAAACKNLANTAKKYSATLIHFSTDYVFDGNAETPYAESSAANPLSIYGQSKLRGEEIIMETYGNSMIFRVAWLYGANGNNFVKTIRRVAADNARTGKPLRVVNDQFGTPTWTVSVCRQVLRALDTRERGIFHCTCEGSCTWYDFAKEIVASANINVDLQPCTTAEFPRPAPRPRYGVLENARLKNLELNIMPDWREAFGEFSLRQSPR